MPQFFGQGKPPLGVVFDSDMDTGIDDALALAMLFGFEGKNEALQERIQSRYLAWPAAEDNSILKLARNRLLGGAAPREIKGAAAQQGLLQIVRDFCVTDLRAPFRM